MLGFIGEHLEIVLIVAAVLFFILQAARLVKKAGRIDRVGIETDAVVTRVEDSVDPDFMASHSYTTYVEYMDDTGELIESPMSLSHEAGHSPGDSVRIRYIPGDRELVREVKDR